MTGDTTAQSSVKNILIDLRSDPSAGTVDVNGIAINSPAQINPLLDHLKSVGFNTVTFNTDVPINMGTGNIALYAPGANPLPSASIWQDVAYAHSIGLAVKILAIPAVVINSDGSINGSDLPISTSTPLAAGVSITTVFANIASYETTLAKLAQQNHVETFYIGHNNYGYDSAIYAPQWQQVINAVRSVYTGTIAYSAAYDNAVFGLVDQIDLIPNPIVSTTPMYNLAQIVEGYYHTTMWTNGPTYFQEIATMIKEYGTKPIILDAFQEQSANTGIGNTFYSFGLMMSDPTAISTLPQPNYREQALAFEAFLYVAQYLMGSQVSGVGISEYDPWAQGTWLQIPQTANARLWHLMNLDGGNLWGNTAAESAITQSLTTNLLPNYFFSTPSNDAIKGNTGALNTAVFYSPFISSNITSDSNRVITVSNSSDGTDTLTNIQRLQFGDGTTLALDIAPTQNAGSVYMLYKAAFNRSPDEGGMGYWLAQKDGGSNIVTNIAQGFVGSKEFTDKYGANPSNASYVDKLYQNVLGRAGDSGGVTYWNGELDAGRISKAAVLVQFATLAEGAALVAPTIAHGIAYTQWVG